MFILTACNGLCPILCNLLVAITLTEGITSTNTFTNKSVITLVMFHTASTTRGGINSK